MSLVLITAPTVPVVSLADAKLHLRVDGIDEDTLISAMVAAATQQAQHETGRALIRQTWERRLDAFPPAEIRLGLPPVSSILSVTYIDPTGATQTVPSASYALDDTVDSGSGWVLPAPGYEWPETADGANVVRVRFQTGAQDAAGVPESIRAWILLQVGALYRNREAFSAGVTVQELPGRFTDMLLDPHRYYGGWWG
jgi:uncharacterized phiE125 gp8 family phage protein